MTKLTRNVLREMILRTLQEAVSDAEFKSLEARKADLESTLRPAFQKLAELLPVITTTSSYFAYDSFGLKDIEAVKEYVRRHQNSEWFQINNLYDFRPIIHIAFGDAPSADYNDTILMGSDHWVANVSMSFVMGPHEFVNVMNRAQSLDDLPPDMVEALNQEIVWRDDALVKPDYDVKLDIYEGER